MWSARTRQKNARGVLIHAAKGNATFFVSPETQGASDRDDSNKERGGHPSRLIFSQVMPSLMHPVGLLPLSPMSFFTLSLSLFVFPRILHLSWVPFPLSALSSLSLSLSRPACLFATHPYVDISLSIDPQGGISLPSFCTGFISFPSIRSFLYTTSQPSRLPPLLHSLAVSPLSIRSFQLLSYLFPSIQRGLYESVLYSFLDWIRIKVIRSF